VLGLGYRIGARLVRALPAPGRYGLTALVGMAFYELHPWRRRSARTNYAAVLGLPENNPEVRRVVRRASANYGRMLADFLLLPTLQSDQIEQMVAVEGMNHIDAALGRGRGAILALPHMGSWDVCGSILGIRGYPVVAVAEPMPGSLNREVVAARSRHGIRIIMLGETGREVGRALEQNQILALLSDVPHGPGIEVNLFGRRAIMPAGPAVLAMRHSAPILPACIWRAASGQHQACVAPPLEPPPPIPSQRREQIAQLTQQLADRFEVFIRQHPDHWYGFRPILGAMMVRG
jgi:lauroyl/myristoyl acyltransferase